MTEEELRVLAWTLLGEAAGEGVHGMEAVAHVIRNRALSGRFPSNPAAVALQASSSGIHQFSAWNDLGRGGNIPRAQYPVGSAAFNRAMSIASKVFGAAPGKDPTQGATHYYSPKGMPNGAEPYWWKSEAPRGGKKIGAHIFAVKRDDIVAPTPARRSSDPVGHAPTRSQMEVFRTGAPLRLPEIGPSGGPSLKKAPRPAKQSLAMQLRRENAGATVVSESRMIYDPVTRTLIKPMPTAGQVRKEIGRSFIERNEPRQPTAKRTQFVAGFAIPGGVKGIAAFERAMEGWDKTPLIVKTGKGSISDRVREARVLPKPRTQTQFAAPVTQPAGSLAVKDEARLPPTKAIPAATPLSGGLSRDAVAARAAGVQAAGMLAVPKMPPMPRARPIRPPVPIVRPQTTPLRIVVQRDPVAQSIRAAPKQQSLYYTDPVAFGNAAVAQSGDTSSGSQAEAAAARASGNAWREAQANK